MSVSDETSFVEAEIAVSATALAVIGILWCTAIALVDRAAFRSMDPYVGNLRFGLWLFLCELLVGVYGIRYRVPPTFPLVKRMALIMAEVLGQIRNLGFYILVNLAIRWILITLLTGAAVAFFTNTLLIRLVCFFPSMTFTIAWLSGISRIGLPPVIRGTHLGSYSEAAAKAAALSCFVRNTIAQKLTEKGIQEVNADAIELPAVAFGGVYLPVECLDPHYLLLGTTSSGKTLMMRMLLQSLFMRFGQRRNRGIIHDAKREYLPLLVGMGVPAEDIVVLNASDSRCSAWNMAADIKNRDDAINITNILVPHDQRGNDNQFFVLAVRSIIAEAMLCLHLLNPGRWRLTDLINALRTLDSLRRLLKTTSDGQEVYLRYFARDAHEMVGGIIATLDARFISKYVTIANVWSNCSESIALTNWIQSRKILLLGYDENGEAQDLINQSIFERASRLLCALPDDPDHREELTIIGMDEPVFLTKIPMLFELTTLGRTKGVRLILAPQDVDGFYERYGNHKADAILALCGNVAALRMTSPKSREWASKLFGDYEAWETETSASTTHSWNGKDHSVSQTSGHSNRRTKREAILPSEFFNLPPTNHVNGMHGFFATPALGAWRAAIPTAWITENLSPADPMTEPYIRRPNIVAESDRTTISDDAVPPEDTKRNRIPRPNGRRTTPGEESHGKATPGPLYDTGNGHTDELPDW